MAAGKGFWGKLGTSMSKVTPEQWKAGARITDKFSGGATGYLGTAIAGESGLDGIRLKNNSNRTEPPGVNDNTVKTEPPKVKTDLSEEFPRK